MKRSGNVVRILFIILFSLSGLTLVAQINDIKESVSLDSLLTAAKRFAYTDRKAEARKVCSRILSIDSTYWDAAVLMGRTYAWDEKYDSARIVLDKIIQQRSGYYDAVDALIDVASLSDNYPDAIKFADLGLSWHPNDDNFLYKKAKALNNSGNSKKASVLLHQILAADSSNKDATGLLLSIRKTGLVNKLTINYWTYAFKDDSPWKFGSVAIGRKTSKLGTVTLRYNYAERFGSAGNQLEIDAYPTIAKGIYLYCSTAISNKKNFPYSRFSIEPYTKLPASFEMSLGFRYLNFDDSRFVVFDASKVMIYTGSIGKYYGDYWFSFRPYLTPGKDGWSKSANLIVRRYLSDEDSYFSLILGTGLSPDEQQYAYNPSLSYLKSSKIALEYQQKIGSGFFLNCGTGFAREEITTGTKRNRFTLDVGVSFLF